MFCQRRQSRLFRAWWSRNTNRKGQNKTHLSILDMRDRAFVFDSTFVSHQSDEENALSLRKRRKKRRRLFDDFCSLSLSLKKTTHRPVARVNQPRRFVRVDFRLLFPMASGIDDISRSRRGSMVAHLHDDDDDGFGACVFVLFLSFSFSLSLRVLNERSFDIESERYSILSIR